jgi:uncharacterized membrane protein
MEIWLYSVVVLAILIAIVFVIREMRKTGGSIGDALKSLTSTPTVTVPSGVAGFLSEPSNQPGGYQPWVAKDE